MQHSPCVELQLAPCRLFRFALNNHRRGSTTVHMSKHTLVVLPSGKQVSRIDSVVRLKPVHIAGMLVASNRGVAGPMGASLAARVPNRVAQRLVDPMFELEVCGEPSGSISMIGDVYRDGFTSRDRWCDPSNERLPLVFRGSEWGALRLFLEASLMASFHFEDPVS